MIAATQLVAHAVGDYLLQSDWMAQEKTRHLWVATVHGLFYALPFLLITQEPIALAAIAGNHALIDRYRLARYILWLKNGINPRLRLDPWADCQATGYHKDRPAWLTVWLMIAGDNTLHVLVNGLVLAYLT